MLICFIKDPINFIASCLEQSLAIQAGSGQKKS
jgi:hypothetical protein